jgi:hypothetical protein
MMIVAMIVVVFAVILFGPCILASRVNLNSECRD